MICAYNGMCDYAVYDILIEGRGGVGLSIRTYSIFTNIQKSGAYMSNSIDKSLNNVPFHKKMDYKR